MTTQVVFTPRAELQLENLYRLIAEASDEARAEGYVGRIVAQCQELRDFPERGRPRFDVRRGLRTIVYRRRVVIAYAAEGETVAILGVFYGGQDYERQLGEDEQGA